MPPKKGSKKAAAKKTTNKTVDELPEQDTNGTSQNANATAMDITPTLDLKAYQMNLIDPDDIAYEEEILRTYSLKSWQRYLLYKASADFAVRVFLYERAVAQHPTSYKLWKTYLDDMRNHLKKKSYSEYEKHFLHGNNAYENALRWLPKMPRLWIDYCEFLMLQPWVTKTRRTFDRALRTLPITLHSRIWTPYLKFAEQAGGETAFRVYSRYLKFEPSALEDFIELLIDNERWTDAAKMLLSIANDEKFRSTKGKSRFQLMSDLCDIVVNHAQDVQGIDFEMVIREALETFKDQRGKLWVSLATYWIRMEDEAKARATFEEGITTVMTVRDFTQIFDAYAEVENSILEIRIEEAQEREEEGEVDEEEDAELDQRFKALEELMDRRPFLVNDVFLRQNENNVPEWQKRILLYGDNVEKVIETYNKAFETINPKKALGRLNDLYVDFSKLYEEGGEPEKARKILEKATKVNFKHVNDLAEVWINWAEMELRLENYDGALDVMKRATFRPRKAKIDFHDDTLPVQTRLFKSLRLWSFYVDLQESIGTIESTKQTYDAIMDLKIANPQIIINYAQFLEENKYFEESFKVYERGVDAFTFPVAFEIWNIYLSKFLTRHGGTKLERTRDLFEQALEKCPPKYAKPIYLMYGKFEEDYGLAKNAMRVYDRATQAVQDEDKFEMFKFYVAKVAANSGITAARPIYERAIEQLPDKYAREIALRYAELERKLGEVDRARAIYAYASQFCDPRTFPLFWSTWHDFEVRHGNEDTFKEMLRIKRSVQALYNTQIDNIAAQTLASGGVRINADPVADAADPMAAMEQAAGRETMSGFVPSKSGVLGGNAVEAEPAVTRSTNADEITIDDDEEL